MTIAPHRPSAMMIAFAYTFLAPNESATAVVVLRHGAAHGGEALVKLGDDLGIAIDLAPEGRWLRVSVPADAAPVLAGFYALAKGTLPTPTL